MKEMKSDPVPGKVLEFGRSLVKSNALSAESQVKVKAQLIEVEKRFETLQSRATRDIDK